MGNENYFIDKISGKLATEFTPKETLLEKVVTNVHSILYWVDRDDIMGAPPLGKDNLVQFNHWETPVQNWWAQNKSKYPITTWSEKPTLTDDIHTESSSPLVLITEPNDTKIYSPNQKINLKIKSSSVLPLQKIDIFINDIYFETIEPPFNFSFLPKEVENLENRNELKIISYDSAFNRNETIAIFRVDF